jgi:hypothetical protein
MRKSVELLAVSLALAGSLVGSGARAADCAEALSSLEHSGLLCVLLFSALVETLYQLWKAIRQVAETPGGHAARRGRVVWRRVRGGTRRP